VLIAALCKAHRMLTWSGALPSIDAAPVSAYNRKVSASFPPTVQSTTPSTSHVISSQETPCDASDLPP